MLIVYVNKLSCQIQSHSNAVLVWLLLLTFVDDQPQNQKGSRCLKESGCLRLMIDSKSPHAQCTGLSYITFIVRILHLKGDVTQVSISAWIQICTTCKLCAKNITRGPWATSLTWETSSNQWIHLSEVVIIYMYYKIGPVFQEEKIFQFHECSSAIL